MTTQSNRNMWLILSGVFVSELAAWIGTIGSLQFLSEQLSSRFLQSFILVSGAVFGIFLAPYAGNVIDRLHPKKILLYSGMLRIAAIGFMLAAIWNQNVWYMIVFQLIIVISSSFYFPTVNAVLPVIVPEDQLMKANMLNFNLTTIARIFGTAIGGVLLTILSLQNVYVISGIIYVVLIILTCMLSFDRSQLSNVTHRARSKASFSELFPLMRREPMVKALLIMTCIPFLFIGGFNVFAIELSEAHHFDGLKGIIYAVEGTSILIAGLAMKKLAQRMSKPALLFGGAMLVIGSLIILIIPLMPVQMIGFAVFGFAGGLFIPLSNTEAQVRISKDALGRFFSLKRMIETSVLQLSLIFTGIILDVSSFQTLMIMYAAVCVICLIGARSVFARTAAAVR